MGGYEDFFKKCSNFDSSNSVEYYEDTHDKNGVYRPLPSGAKAIGNVTPFSKNNGFVPPPLVGNATPIYPNSDTHSINSNQFLASSATRQAVPLPSVSQDITPRNYQNVVIYEPKAPEDVQSLIDYLMRKEPAIVKLDNLEVGKSQRILDYLSGAIYALHGSVHKIDSNIFLLSPEGVTISTPLE